METFEKSPDFGLDWKTREQIFSKDYLKGEDIALLLGQPLQRAYGTIRNIKRVTDRLGIKGKIAVQDYIDYYNLDIRRYIGGEKDDTEKV